MEDKSVDRALQILNKNFKDGQENLMIYLSEIKKRVNRAEYEEFIQYLNNVESIVKFHSKTPSGIKNLFYNVIKGAMIQSKRIEIGDKVTLEFCSIAEKYKKDLDVLKNYVENLTEIMEENKLEIPDIEPICLETSVCSKSSIDKRLEVLKLASRNDNDINDFIKNIQKGKSAQISNETLKKAAKDNNINIRISKQEINKVIKN